jgi:hypothetical protein
MAAGSGNWTLGNYHSTWTVTAVNQALESIWATEANISKRLRRVPHFTLLPETTLINAAVHMEKRTNWVAAVSLILGSSFLLALLFFLRTPFDAPLPYREFRRIISVAPFVGVVLGHLAWRQIRPSEDRVGGLQLAIAGLFLGYLGIAFLIATVVR